MNQPGRYEVREIRIHGVGGSPAEALLGLRSREDSVVVGERRGTVFLARRADREGRNTTLDLTDEGESVPTPARTPDP